jgi:hypothetical protein
MPAVHTIAAQVLEPFVGLSSVLLPTGMFTDTLDVGGSGAGGSGGSSSRAYRRRRANGYAHSRQ